MRSRLALALILTGLATVTLLAQTRTWFTAVIPFDATGNPKFAAAATGAQGTPRTLANTPVNFDASGFPKFVLAAGTATPTTLTTGDGTCAAPGIAFTSQPGLGLFRNGTDDVILCNGAAVPELRFVTNFLVMKSAGSVSWTAANADGTVDHSIGRRLGGVVMTGTAQAMQLSTVQTTAPTCVTNCGTPGNVVAGTDTAGIVTMGTTPASGFIVLFNGTWTAAPACVVQPALAGMATGKKALTVATTTGQFTVVTDGTAPVAGDLYAYVCLGKQ